MAAYNDMLQAIGKTPLIRLYRLTQSISSPSMAKLNFSTQGAVPKISLP